MLGANNIVQRPERDVTWLYAVMLSGAEITALAEQTTDPIVAAKLREILQRAKEMRP